MFEKVTPRRLDADVWTDDEITGIKRDINQLVFEKGASHWTLDQAEGVACNMLKAFMDGPAV